MLNVRESIVDALAAALEGQAEVYAMYPKTGARYPSVSYYESENRRFAQTDGGEHLSEITYVVDVWSESTATNIALSGLIDDAMTALGFVRAFAMDVDDPNCKHTTMRFRAVIDQGGNAYQG